MALLLLHGALRSGTLVKFSEPELARMTSSRRKILDIYLNQLDVTVAVGNGVVAITPPAASKLSPIAFQKDNGQNIWQAFLAEVGKIEAP